MEQVKLTTGEYLLVEVPEGCHEIEINYGKDKVVFWEDGFSSELGLPPGQWEIIGRASELSEEQWSGIVEPIGGWSSVLYYDYSASGRDYRDIIESGLKSPTESGLSLIKSHSMNPETTLVIRKPVKQ